MALKTGGMKLSVAEFFTGRVASDAAWEGVISPETLWVNCRQQVAGPELTQKLKRDR